MDDTRFKSFELWPQLHSQPREFFFALEKAYKQGGWTVCVDELLRIDRYGLREHVENLLTQGRSLGISVLVGMQRPAQITRFALSESSHVISFNHEGRDAKTLAESTSPRLFPVVESLQRHEFVWFHRPTKQFWRGYIQDLEKE
jgi:hypothetical protein